MAKGYKTGGRQKGTPNKATTRLRELLFDAAEQYIIDGMAEDLKESRPSARLHHLREVLKLIVPKPNEDLQPTALVAPTIIVRRMDGKD